MIRKVYQLRPLAAPFTGFLSPYDVTPKLDITRIHEIRVMDYTVLADDLESWGVFNAVIRCKLEYGGTWDFLAELETKPIAPEDDYRDYSRYYVRHLLDRDYIVLGESHLAVYEGQQWVQVIDITGDDDILVRSFDSTAMVAVGDGPYALVQGAHTHHVQKKIYDIAVHITIPEMQEQN